MSVKSAIRRRASGEHGFTLIELLVVILIIGILAAIVIPSFLNQKGKATDAAAKELAHTMQVAAESFAGDQSGSYAGLTPSILNQYEGTIQVGSAPAGNAYVALAGGVTNVTANSYTLTATAATTGDTFSIIRAASGTTTRQCKTVAATQSGCPAAQNSTASW